MCDQIYSNFTNKEEVNIGYMMSNSRKMGIMVYLGVLSVIGSLGNAFLLKYIVTQKRTTRQILLQGLAVSDLLVCSITVPFEIFDLKHENTFYSNVGCKLFRTSNYLFICTSILMLMVLSLDRFLRVCKPLGTQICIKSAKIVIIINVSIAVIFSWPNLLFFNSRKIVLPNNETGYDCTTAEEYESTTYTLIYSVVLLIMFLVFFVTLIVFYSMIGKRVFSHLRYKEYFKQMQSNVCFRRSQSQEVMSVKITKISFIISTVFVVSYSPFLAVSILEALAGQCYTDPKSTHAFILQIVERFYIFNHVANPFIYGIIDKNFRIMLENISKLHIVCRK